MFWAEDLFQDKSFAKYYTLGQDRSADDVRSMIKRRVWNVRIRNIQYRNYGELGDFFVKFNFGYNFRLSRKFLRLKASGAKKKKKEKSGRQAEEERRWKWVQSGTMGKTIYTGIVMDVDKGKTVDIPDEIEFDWFGTYFDLYDLMLHAEVWIYNNYKPNEMLAMAEKSLLEIATGEMNMAGPEWEIKKDIRRKGRKEKVNIGALEFQCVLQEVLNYSLKFQNWSVKFFPWEVLRNIEEDDEEILYPYLKFHLHSAHNILKSTRTKSRKVSFRGRDFTVKIDATPSDSNISFTGTRVAFEESVLFVHMYDGGIIPFRDDLLGSARIPLTNVVEGGFLSARLSMSRDSSSKWITCTTEPPANSIKETGRVFGTCDIEVTESRSWKLFVRNPMDALRGGNNARLYREFAQVGSLHPPELKDYPPFNYSYLAVRIISASNLIGADASGLSDPYCTVEWGDQRQKTRVIAEELNPIFDETLYFQVPAFNAEKIGQDELAEYPCVRICVWDSDETGSSDLLGTCKLYLHHITGQVGDDGENRNFPRPKRMVVKRRKRRGQKKLREETIMTRIFEKDLRLEGLPNGVESFVKVAAFFRAPGDGDLKETDPLKIARNGTDLLLLPNMVNKEKEGLYSCLCSARTFLKQGQRGGKRQTCQNVQNNRLCLQYELFYNRIRQQNNERFALLNRLQKDLNLNVLRGMNEFGERHFLCTFLQPVTPPRSFIAPEEVQFMSIRSSQKPKSCYKAARFVRAMEFWDYVDSFFDGSVNINPDVWLSPPFFLGMKKGDVKAHVLQLANFFLGLMTDCYVCLGYATNVDGGKLPYVWLMTRESTSDSCTRATTSKKYEETSKLRNLGIPNFGGAVKFWEVTQGAYYSPLPNRWTGQDDDEVMQASKRKKRKKKSKATSKKTEEVVTGGPEPEEDDGTSYEIELDEEDLLYDKRRFDVSVDVDQIFELGPEIGDNFGVAAKSVRQFESAVEVETEKYTVEDDDESIPDLSQMALDERKAYEEKKALFKIHLERVDWIKRQFKRLEHNDEFQLPYTDLVAVFNHENFWVSVQEHTDPRRMTYDMDKGVEFGWLELVKEDNQYAVSPYYQPRTLSSKLTEVQQQQLQKLMYSELLSSIENHRSLHNASTRFADGAIVTKMEELLEARLALELLDRSKINGWVSDPISKSGGYWKKTTREYRRVMSLTKVLILSTPPGYKSRLSFVKVNSADPSDVRKYVLRKSQLGDESEPPIFEEFHKMKESFAVGVKVNSWPNGLCNVYVGIMAIYPDTKIQEPRHTEIII